MNSTARIYVNDTLPPHWQPVFDSNSDFYFRNELNQQHNWNLPKKVKTTPTNFIPIEQFISTNDFTVQSTSLPNQFVTLPSKINLMSKCHKCDTDQDIRQHGFCGKCYIDINSYKKPLVSEHKLKCQGCHGWGVNLVKDDGVCSYCRDRMDNGLEVKVYDDYEANSPIAEPIKCQSCGGWGKDLVKENGLCNYCFLKLEKEKFEAEWKTKCNSCGGWGLKLVKENGLCNHCKRQLDSERMFFSQVLEKHPEPIQNFTLTNQTLNEYDHLMNTSILGKRERNDDFEFLDLL